MYSVIDLLVRNKNTKKINIKMFDLSRHILFYIREHLAWTVLNTRRNSLTNATEKSKNILASEVP